MAMGLTPNESAAIALVGGADGPMVLFGSVVMAKHLFVPISVIAYLYLSITYAVYPYLTKIVPIKMRAIEMDWHTIPVVSTGAKFAFSIIACGLLCTLFPVASPLIACFFLGVALKEGGVTRYLDFISGPLLYGATLFLSFTLGALLSADIVMDPKVGLLLVLGIIALLLSGVGGLVGGIIYSKLSRKPFNPLLGIAAVSCIPTTAKIAQKAAAQANPRAMILPFTMGPNIAGIITTAVVTGIFINGVGFLT